MMIGIIIALVVCALGGITLLTISGSTLVSARLATVAGASGGTLGYITGGYTRLADIIQMGLGLSNVGAIVLTLGIGALVLVMIWNFTVTGGKKLIQ